MKNRLLTIAILILAINGLGFSEITKETVISQPVDLIGNGGTGVASSGKFGNIFVNPASLGIPDNGQFSILKLGLRANTDIYGLVTEGMSLANSGFDVSKLTAEQLKMIMNLNTLVGLNGPISIGYIGNGIGLLAYDDFYTKIRLKQATGIPYLDLGIYFDIGLTVGYGFEVPLILDLGKYSKLYAGVNLKFLNRIKYEDDRLNAIVGMDEVMSIMEGKKGILMAQYLGMDIGAILKLENLNLGLMVKDLFSTGFTWRQYALTWPLTQMTNGSTNYAKTYFPISVDLGATYSFDFGLFFLPKIEVSMDLVNIFDFSENYFLKVRIGAEAAFFDMIKFRVGLYKGYPTLGVGFDFPFIHINAAYYSEELGSIPGTQPQQNVILDFQFVI